MKQPDIPDNEQARLAALRRLNILDTPPEERFDRVTRLSRRIFDVPIAVISLVDENRQWFKSIMGLDASETLREYSFCGHTILGDDIMIVPNAKEDERFHDNPAVQGEPHVRFYAGCPIRALNGEKLGTLCIIDQKPRKLERKELETLKDLATMVESELAAIQMATLDELTGISNRRGFISLAQYSLNLCVRQHLPASLVFIDLNKFKHINDTYGHAEGDVALMALAEQLKVTFRDSDLFARLGGDEFVVLLTNSDRAHAEDILHRLEKNIARLNQERQRGYNLSIAYGIVEFDSHKHRDIDALLAEGDALMYEKKKSR